MERLYLYKEVNIPTNISHNNVLPVCMASLLDVSQLWLTVLLQVMFFHAIHTVVLWGTVCMAAGKNTVHIFSDDISPCMDSGIRVYEYTHACL